MLSDVLLKYLRVLSTVLSFMSLYGFLSRDFRLSTVNCINVIACRHN